MGFLRILRRPKGHRQGNELPLTANSKSEEEEEANVQTAGPEAAVLQPQKEDLQPPLPVFTSTASITSSNDDSTLASQPLSNVVAPSFTSKDRQYTSSTNISTPLEENEPLIRAVDSRDKLSPSLTGSNLQPDTTLATTRPAVVVQQPTPPPRNDNVPPPDRPHPQEASASVDGVEAEPDRSKLTPDDIPLSIPPESPSICELPSPAQATQKDESSPRQQPIVSSANAPSLHTTPASSGELTRSPATNTSSSNQDRPQETVKMLQRKIWVKRPGQSATMVTIQADDLVDDVRDKILRKYANSLGRSFDSPDVTLRIVTRQDGPRSAPAERMLGPEEEMCKTLDQYYHGGQTVADALIIDIPPKRTPRPSPRQHQGHGSHGHIPYHALEDYRPQESGTDYFPPMPAIIAPAATQNGAGHDPRILPTHMLHLPDHPARSISVLQTGQVPPLPSPGAATRRHRPKYGRQHTSSPTIVSHATTSGAVAVNSPGPGASQHLALRGRPRHDSNASERPNGIPAPPPLPTPPASEIQPTKTATPPTPLARDHHRARPRKTRKVTPTNGTSTLKPGNAISSLLDGSVPPINVLIVEDNIINLKLLEAFMKRLKVRWSTAMNGQIAVNKWKQGGFHLVLMDIQLPIMSGLEATKEIRRLERVNGIGVFSSSTPTTPMAKTLSDGEANGEQVKEAPADPEKDKLKLEGGLFKSPVIIVALTASSLQSDRHEALAAGCNDFLTKPVNFVWMERKVKEWGCMQALIDYDGWRQWKDFTSAGAEVGATKANGKLGANAKSPTLDGVSKADLAAKAREKKLKRDKRTSSDHTSTVKKTGVDTGNEAADEAA